MQKPWFLLLSSCSSTPCQVIYTPCLMPAGSRRSVPKADQATLNSSNAISSSNTISERLPVHCRIGGESSHQVTAWRPGSLRSCRLWTGRSGFPGVLLAWDKSFNLGALDLRLERTLPSLAGCCEGPCLSSGWVFRCGGDEATDGILPQQLVPVPRLGVFCGAVSHSLLGVL